MWWVNTSDELLSKHLLNIYLLALLPYEVINILKLHMLFLTIFTQSFYSDIHISIYMQFSYSGYVSAIWGWEKIILNVMSGGNQKSLLGGDFFFIRLWETEKECIWSRANLFQSIKTTFSKYWTSVKVKISMACV